MSAPNYQTMAKNKKANVRLRAAQDGPLDIARALTADSNKRVKRAAEKRVKEGQ